MYVLLVNNYNCISYFTGETLFFEIQRTSINSFLYFIVFIYQIVNTLILCVGGDVKVASEAVVRKTFFPEFLTSQRNYRDYLEY